jgi:hypothetical protein
VGRPLPRSYAGHFQLGARMGASKKRPKMASRKNRKATSVYYLCGDVKCVTSEAQEYAHLKTSVEIWISAARKDSAARLARRQLEIEGWRFKKLTINTKVPPGFARIGSMMDPPVFSDEEADEWNEQYRLAEVKGFAYSISHY